MKQGTNCPSAFCVWNPIVLAETQIHRPSKGSLPFGEVPWSCFWEITPSRPCLNGAPRLVLPSVGSDRYSQSPTNQGNPTPNTCMHVVEGSYSNCIFQEGVLPLSGR